MSKFQQNSTTGNNINKIRSEEKPATRQDDNLGIKKKRSAF